MSTLRARWWRKPVCVLGGAALWFALPLAQASAQEQLPAPKEPPAEVKGLSIKTVTLPEALRLAMENQPNLAAARASLAAAATSKNCLDKLHVPPLFPGSKELPVRRKQACLGVAIAQANLTQIEFETAYAVTRTYYTAVYARAQQRVADDVVASLRFYQERVSDAVKKGESREFTTNTVDKITVYLRLAEVKQVEAAQGVDRAQAALREAIGIGPYCCIKVADEKLAAPEVSLCCEEVVHQALSRRAEIVQANTALEVYNLEIDAQAANCLPGVTRTFAAGSDIHAKVIPPPIINGEYRPGALLPEMPVSFAGKRCCRVERAKDFVGRATAVADKTRNLITLEAEDAYFKWLEFGQKVTQSRDGAIAGDRLAKNTREDFRAEQKVKIDDVLTNEVTAAQARSTHNEAVYNYILTLAGLERITAGGFQSGLTPPWCANGH